MMHLSQVMGEYLVHLDHLTAARRAYRQDPTRNNLIRYMSAVKASTDRKRHLDVIRSIDFNQPRQKDLAS